jgi:hypothetical protein
VRAGGGHAAGRALAAGLPDRAAAGELVVAFAITAIRGPAATCGIAAAALPAPRPRHAWR